MTNHRRYLVAAVLAVAFMLSFFTFPTFVSGGLGVFFIVYLAWIEGLRGGIAGTALGSLIMITSYLLSAPHTFSRTGLLEGLFIYAVLGPGLGKLVSDRRWAQGHMSRARQHQEILLHNIDTHVWYLRDPCTYGEVNRSHARFWGKEPDELRGRPLSDVRAPDELEACVSGNREVFSARRPVQAEEWIRDAGGEAHLMAVTKHPYINRDGEVEYVICSANDITEHWRALQAQRESERRFRGFVENANDIVFTCDERAVFRYVSPNWQDILGHDPDEVRGKHPGDFVHPDDAERLFSEFREFLREGPSNQEIQYRVQRSDGQWRWHATKLGILEDNGRGVTILGIARDITDRKHAEQRLRKSEAQYRQLTETLQEGIWALDAEGYTTFTNESMAKMLGYTPEEMQGTHLFAHLDAEDVESARRNLSRRAAGIQEQHEQRFLRSDGTYLHASLTTTPILDDEENYTGALAGVQDITERKRAEERLQESERKFRRYIEHAPHGIFVADGQGYYREVNPSACDMSGYSEDELVGRHLTELVAEGSREDAEAHFDRVVREGKSRGELHMTTKDGRIRVWSISAAKISEDSYLGLHQDITDRKRAEERLQVQLRFERMVARISSHLASLSLDHIDEGIDYALRETGRFFSVDRAYIFQFSGDGQHFSNTHEWCSDGVDAVMHHIQDQPVHSLPWFMERIRSDDHVLVPDVRQLPPEAHAERAEWGSQGIESLLCVPMTEDDQLLGFLGFDAVRRRRTVAGHQIALLQVVAEMISAAISRRRADEEIRYLSFHDGLTGLYNRHYLDEELRRLEAGRQLPVGVIMADLNGLKLVNDAYGHDVGDEMLKSAAALLHSAIRSEDIVGRWGGDEFVMILPQTGHDALEDICRRIEAATAGISVRDVPISLALGWAVKEESDENLLQVLNEAEDDMYRNKLAESRSQKSAVMDGLLRALREKSTESEEHSRRMRQAARQIGAGMGLGHPELRRLELVVWLHDIGKITIAEDILRREGSVSGEEEEVLRKHPETGYRIARSTEEFSHIAEEILSHHECWDGSGYPRGLQGEDIPLLARIIHVAGAYENMISARGKEPLSHREAMAELRRGAGSRYDPDVVQAAETHLQPAASCRH